MKKKMSYVLIAHFAHLQLNAEVAANRHVQESGRLEPDIDLTVGRQTTRALNLQLHRAVSRVDTASRLHRRPNPIQAVSAQSTLL